MLVAVELVNELGLEATTEPVGPAIARILAVDPPSVARLRRADAPGFVALARRLHQCWLEWDERVIVAP